MMVDSLDLSSGPESDAKDAAELAAFLAYALPEVARLDSEAAAYLAAAVARLRAIAQAPGRTAMPKH